MLSDSLYDPTGIPARFRMVSTEFETGMDYSLLMLSWRLVCFLLRLILLSTVLGVVLGCEVVFRADEKADRPYKLKDSLPLDHPAPFFITRLFLRAVVLIYLTDAFASVYSSDISSGLDLPSALIALQTFL